MKKLYYLLLLLLLLLPAISFAQWEPCNEGLTGFNNQCLLIDKDTIFAGGTGGVYYSADYGSNWQKISVNLANATVWCLLKKESEIFVGTPGGIYFTSDYGGFWMKRSSGLLDNRIICLEYNGTDILAGSLNTGIFSSSDNGGRWFPKNKGISNMTVYDILKKDTKIYVAVPNDSGNGGVYYTKDNCANWTLSGLKNKDLYNLFSKGNEVFAGTGGDGLFVSTDGGSSWIDRKNGEMMVTIQAIESYKQYLFIALWNGGVLYSDDNGFTWVSKSDGLSNLTLRSLKVCGDYLIAGTYYGGMYRAKIADIVPTDVEESELTRNISVYPNPAIDNISFQTNKDFQRYIIYDLNGRICQTGIIIGNSITLDRLEPGLHFLYINNGIERVTSCFVKN